MKEYRNLILLSVGSSANGFTRGPSLPTRSTLSAVQLDDTLIAAADIEDVGEAAVLLLQRNRSGSHERTSRFPLGR